MTLKFNKIHEVVKLNIIKRFQRL